MTSLTFYSYKKPPLIQHNYYYVALCLDVFEEFQALSCLFDVLQLLQDYFCVFLTRLLFVLLTGVFNQNPNVSVVRLKN